MEIIYRRAFVAMEGAGAAVLNAEIVEIAETSRRIRRPWAETLDAAGLQRRPGWLSTAASRRRVERPFLADSAISALIFVSLRVLRAFVMSS
jgi:hypothetical protein